MELTIKKRARTVLSEGGIPFCEVVLSLPEPLSEGKAAERLSRFYGGVEEGVFSLAKEILLPYARSAYEKNSDPRRRFTHRPFLLCCTAAMGEGGMIVRRLQLMWRGRPLFERTVYESVTEDGRVIPIRKGKIRA